ncbi:acyl-CoA/acyl-ACP dehydrogenase [Actinoallomurus sp. NBC_01490]|uniref:acyl-CoA dehydrogenase family protein n=1 Tax=Actinoallomurus sp. NBC_01490 TaxID=2903557 RepID=UPI002E37EEC7|nr:acyl-CoA dehydrogenase family protein [Actinoallomurus sp. NBC_01490]
MTTFATPALDPDLRTFADTIADFARERLATAVRAAEESDTPSADLFARPAEQGLWTLGADERHGGGGADPLALVLAAGNAATTAPAVAAAMGSVHGALHAVRDEDTAALIAGDGLPAVPIDTADPLTSLKITPTGDGAMINGTAARVEGAGEASAFVVVDAEAGALIIDPAACRLSQPIARTGLRGWAPRTVTFTEVTCAAVLPATPERSRETRALLLGAAAAGVASSAAAAARGYVVTRHQFGAPIADLPAVAALTAEMEQDAHACAVEMIELAGAIAASAPWFQPSPDAARACAQRCARTAVRVAERAIQLHGGYGYLREYPVERALRDVVTLRALIAAIP